jgi:hypothetical protein
VRQFYAPHHNATFTLIAAETPVDVSKPETRADADALGVSADCLLRLRGNAGAQAARRLDAAAAACRDAPWSHHLPHADVLVLNVGHHYHLYDPSFQRYADMVAKTLEVVRSKFRGTFVFRSTNAGFAPVSVGCAPFACTRPLQERLPEVQDKFHWGNAVRADSHWAAAIAAWPSESRTDAFFLNVTASSALRPDAMSSDCLHPDHPVYVHWFALLGQLLAGESATSRS